MITWTAENNSSFLVGTREASTVLAAVRAARKYVRNELYGEGVLTIFIDGQPIRQDRCDIFTSHRWESNTDIN